MLHETGIENLRVGILAQAVKDYITALRHDNPRKIFELETFFKSGWGEMLSDNHGDYIITECKKRAKAKKG